MLFLYLIQFKSNFLYQRNTLFTALFHFESVQVQNILKHGKLLQYNLLKYVDPHRV